MAGRGVPVAAVRACAARVGHRERPGRRVPFAGNPYAGRPARQIQLERKTINCVKFTVAGEDVMGRPGPVIPRELAFGKLITQNPVSRRS
jgi:hypothetical protein